MGHIVVDLLHLAAAVYVVMVVMRTVAQLTKNRLPAVSHALEYGIGK